MSTASTTISTEIRLPAAGVWKSDASHSTVGAIARHLMVTKVRGHFTDFEATITVAQQPADSSVVATIAAASLTSGNEQRDGHLLSPDFLDAEQFPTLEFRSTGLRQTGETTFDLPGEMTIRGVTKPVVFSVEYFGLVGDPWGGERAGFSATAEINREEFGMTWNAALEAGGVLVGKKFTIELDLQFVKQTA